MKTYDMEMTMTFSEWETLHKEKKIKRIRNILRKVRQNYITVALIIISFISKIVCDGDNTAGVFFFIIAVVYAISVNSQRG